MASKAASCFQAGMSQACKCWSPCEGNLSIFHNLDQKKIVVNANKAPKRGSNTQFRGSQRVLRFNVCTLWMFPKAILIHRQHSLSCLLLCHSYRRFHPVPLDCANRRKHSPCSMDLTHLGKSRYRSLHNGKEKQDSRYPGATRCFGKKAAWQLQSPHAPRTDRCWSAVRFQPVRSCMVGNSKVTYKVQLTFVSYQKHAYYTSFNVGSHTLLV